MSDNQEPEYLTCRELQALLRVTESSIWRLIRAGRIPPPIKLIHKRIWNKAEVEEWIRRPQASKKAAKAS